MDEEDDTPLGGDTESWAAKAQHTSTTMEGIDACLKAKRRKSASQVHYDPQVELSKTPEPT